MYNNNYHNRFPLITIIFIILYLKNINNKVEELFYKTHICKLLTNFYLKFFNIKNRKGETNHH